VPVCSTGGGPLDVGKLCAADLYAGIAIDTDGRCHAPFYAPPTTDLRWADLRNCKLAGAAFEAADFERASLAGADLQGADLTGSKIFLADLSGANLRGAILDQAVISTASPARTSRRRIHDGRPPAGYKNTTCPDGTNSDLDGERCLIRQPSLPWRADPQSRD
jgi:uncharacterized protein YjbI with pentapeptide repeats